MAMDLLKVGKQILQDWHWLSLSFSFSFSCFFFFYPSTLSGFLFCIDEKNRRRWTGKAKIFLFISCNAWKGIPTGRKGPTGQPSIATMTVTTTFYDFLCLNDHDHKHNSNIHFSSSGSTVEVSGGGGSSLGGCGRGMVGFTDGLMDDDGKGFGVMYQPPLAHEKRAGGVDQLTCHTPPKSRREEFYIVFKRTGTAAKGYHGEVDTHDPRTQDWGTWERHQPEHFMDFFWYKTHRLGRVIFEQALEPPCQSTIPWTSCSFRQQNKKKPPRIYYYVLQRERKRDHNRLLIKCRFLNDFFFFIYFWCLSWWW